MNPLRALEDLARGTRTAWLGLGQLGLVVLGLHFAADRLDDHLYTLLAAAGALGGGALEPLTGAAELDPDLWVQPARWAALVAELLGVLYAFNALTLTPHHTALSWAAWRRCLGVEALVLPLFWSLAAAVGAGVLGMAVEDGLAGISARAAVAPPGGLELALRAAGWGVAGLAAWRLGFTGWRRVVTGLSPPAHPTQGLAWAPLALGLTALLLAHGVPWRALWP